MTTEEIEAKLDQLSQASVLNSIAIKEVTKVVSGIEDMVKDLLDQMTKAMESRG